MGMTVEEYRKRMMNAFHNADCEELIALVVSPTEKEFRHLEWLLKTHYKTPKEQYEARLKADMVAMLTDIQLELDEMKITKVRSAGFAPYSKDPFRRGVNCSKEIIQQKINSLKGDSNDKID